MPGGWTVPHPLEELTDDPKTLATTGEGTHSQTAATVPQLYNGGCARCLK